MSGERRHACTRTKASPAVRTAQRAPTRDDDPSERRHRRQEDSSRRPNNPTPPFRPFHPTALCSVVNRFFTVLAAASSLPPLNHNSLPPPPHRGVDLPPVYTQSTPRKQSAIAVYKIYLLGAAAPETPLVFDAASFFSFFSPSLNGRRLRSNTRLRRSFTLRTRTKRRCTAASTQ